LCVFTARGLYRLHRRVSTLDELMRVVKSTLLTLPWLFTAAFFYRDFSYSRAVFLLIVVNTVIILTAERALMQSWQRKLYRRGIGVLRAAVCGSGSLAREIHARIRDNPHLGYRSQGFIFVGKASPQVDPLLGSIERMQEIVSRHDLDLLFIALEPTEREQLPEIIQRCEGINLEFYLAPDQAVLGAGRVQPKSIAGMPLLKIKESALFGWKGVVKRAFDLGAAGLLLTALSPLFALIALLVKFDSKGPLSYAQERVGLDGRSFRILKFRTMRPEAENETGPVWAKKDDVRTTSVGRILRRLSLDELPQLINVLKGDMSLVGPRPERPHFVGQFRQHVPHYLERHRVRSGMTGWAQVNGLRGNTSIEDRTKYDVYYVENWSLAFDLKILLLTIREVLFGKQAY
jgi:exopolysaccharide biosynthesis polyprenyl glycosylphosphotransferase